MAKLQWHTTAIKHEKPSRFGPVFVERMTGVELANSTLTSRRPSHLMTQRGALVGEPATSSTVLIDAITWLLRGPMFPTDSCPQSMPGLVGHFGGQSGHRSAVCRASPRVPQRRPPRSSDHGPEKSVVCSKSGESRRLSGIFRDEFEFLGPCHDGTYWLAAVAGPQLNPGA